MLFSTRKRPAGRLLALALLLAGCLGLRAQVFDATRLVEPADLATPWRIQAGDNPAWAQPEFDDSAWPLFDPHGSLGDSLGGRHPEIVWYRLRIRLAPGASDLALREQMIAHAYELYINGERLLAAGSVAPYRAATMGGRRLAPIPGRILASGTLVVALRVHIAPSDWAGSNPGLFAANLTLGQRAVLDREDWLVVIGENGLSWIASVSLIFLGLAALVLYIAQPTQREYFWIVLLALIRLIQLPCELAALFHELPIRWQLISGFPYVFTPLVYAGLYVGFAGIRVRRRTRLILLLIGVLNGLSFSQGLWFNFPVQLQFLLSLPAIVLLAVVLPLILARSFRRGNHEAGILLIPIVLLSLYVYAKVVLGTLYQFPSMREQALAGINLIDRTRIGPFTFSFEVLCALLATQALAVILLLRSSRVARRKAELDTEMEAAQQVQQYLLPDQDDAVPGFTVECIYQPAREVGGDFFQILPTAGGGMIVVVGDVAGKGLPAAMLVSALVGAIRTAATFTQDPAELLSNLNSRMACLSTGGFATALVARIGPDGQVSIANAGHLSPYLDGRELDLPGALPLGITTPIGYETHRFRLAPGSRLVFLSDGVVEARNPHGELFGFERSRELSTQPAAAIAQRAQDFGQEDDITVLTIARAAAVATAA